MHHNCNECTRLWNEYALSTRHYLKLSGKLEIAESSNDERTATELRPLVGEAAAERDEVRQRIEGHGGSLKSAAAGC
jgi:hypothetical protein